jgi:hypothetical protein
MKGESENFHLQQDAKPPESASPHILTADLETRTNTFRKPNQALYTSIESDLKAQSRLLPS